MCAAAAAAAPATGNNSSSYVLSVEDLKKGKKPPELPQRNSPRETHIFALTKTRRCNVKMHVLLRDRNANV